MKRKFLGSLLLVYAISTLVFIKILPEEGTAQNVFDSDFSMSPTDFGVLCISSVYPGAVEGLADSRDNEEQGADVDEENTVTEVKNEDEDSEPVVFGDDPAVLIVHTHATETYLPASEGNYHSKKEENSVRDVGNVLAESLEEEGISVVHDKTLHDNPSYSSSYSRSYETIEKLLDEYPSITCVIDLHRDAIASEATAATVSVNGKTCARYMYVVSTAVPTYESNIQFVNNLNETAKDGYNGYTGSVLERGYQYNQNLSEKYLLLEIGNNRNDIQDVRNSARIIGKILADTLKKGG